MRIAETARPWLDLNTKAGRRFNHALAVVILAATAGLVAEVCYTANDQAVPGWLRAAELAVWILFCAEYAARILLAENRRAYIRSFYGIIDLLAVIGGPSSTAALGSIRLLRVLRVLRIVKLVRGSAAIDRFRAAAKDIADELAVYLSASGILMFIASVGIYELEHDQPDTLYVSIFDSFYWAVLSLTAGAEGYQPLSGGGKLLSIFIVLIGLGVVAVPSGLLASALYKHDASGHSSANTAADRFVLQIG